MTRLVCTYPCDSNKLLSQESEYARTECRILESFKESFETIQGISRLRIQICFILSSRHCIQSKTQHNRSLFLSTTQRFQKRADFNTQASNQARMRYCSFRNSEIFRTTKIKTRLEKHQIRISNWGFEFPQAQFSFKERRFSKTARTFGITTTRLACTSPCDSEEPISYTQARSSKETEKDFGFATTFGSYLRLSKLQSFWNHEERRRISESTNHTYQISNLNSYLNSCEESLWTEKTRGLSELRRLPSISFSFSQTILGRFLVL